MQPECVNNKSLTDGSFNKLCDGKLNKNLIVKIFIQCFNLIQQNKITLLNRSQSFFFILIHDIEEENINYEIAANISGTFQIRKLFSLLTRFSCCILNLFNICRI